MTWHVRKNKERLIQIIEHSIADQTEVKVHVEGEKVGFCSRFIDIVQKQSRLDKSQPDEDNLELVMEKVNPDFGNHLIKQFPQVCLDFPMQEILCRCFTRYIGLSAAYPDTGLMMTFPLFIEMQEMRREKRLNLITSHFISAVFQWPSDRRETRAYELDVINWSKHGLGLVITKKDQKLISLLAPGDRIPGITLFSPSALTRFDGTVKHMTRIEVGKFKGSYVLGLRSNVILGIQPKMTAS